MDDNYFFVAEASNFHTFAKAAYQKTGSEYPKFHKMDALSKLAFLGSELILQHTDTKDIALVFANTSASLDTDIRHQESIQDKEQFFPSPAVFVYTLPNICIGEVSIRHELHSESIFFVQEQYDIPTMKSYSEYLLDSGKAEKVLCAWVEYLNESYDAFFYLVSKEGTIPHEIEEIKKITE